MSRLELRFLGEFEVIRDGQTMPLPPSRKTRALLAYLVLNRRRFRREQLCELLWEIPDDPRGSLRWSLSKLRKLLDDDEHVRIRADRLGIEVDTADMLIDVTELHALADGGLSTTPIERLEDAARRFRGNFLEGLELSNFHDFHAWCVAERELVARAQAALLRNLVNRLAESPERVLPYARALVGISPYDEPSRAELIRVLVSSRHIDEAEQQYRLGLRMLKEAGVSSNGALLQARRGAGDAAAEPREIPLDTRSPASTEKTDAATMLVGRDDETRQIASAMTNVARSGNAQALLLRGEAGIGKSRLLEFAARGARASNALVLAANAFEAETIRPFSLWIDALRGAASNMADHLFGRSDLENRDCLFSGLSEFVASESGTRPVVLVFDDIHWCDESSAAALHYVLRTNRSRPVLGVLATRDTELHDNAPFQQALRGLRHDGLLQELKLAPLSPAAIAQLIGERAPGAESERLSLECGGNPLLAIELARAVIEGAGGGSLHQLVRERLARFGADGAEVLRWASLLSSRIGVSTLVELTGLPDDDVGRILESAERQAILSSNDRGLRFSHELIARAVYAEISPLRRQFMHRRIAEHIEQHATLDMTHAADLVHHANQSGDPGLAARALVSAGRLCLRFFANEEALSLARKGLQLVEALPDAERVCLSVDLHDIILSAAPLENWEEAARKYVELAEQALDHGALAHARLGYHMASYVRWAHGQWTGAREQTLQAERAIRGGSDEDQIVGMAETAKCLVVLERDLPQADAMLLEANALASRKRVRHHAVPAGLGMLRFYDNKLDEAEVLFKEARTLCKSAGDRVNEYQANEYLAMIDIQRGRCTDAKIRCEELLAIGNKLRGGSEAPFAQALHGLCVYALDDQSDELEAALQDLRIADAKHRLAYVLTRAALLDYERGRITEAIRHAAESLTCAEVLERATETMLAHLVLGLGKQVTGDKTESTSHFAAVTRLDTAGVAAWARVMAARYLPVKKRKHG
jgi:DNA-binding SARP family transcriptional activator